MKSSLSLMLMVGLGKLLSFLPSSMVHYFGVVLGALVYSIGNKRQKITEENLKKAFPQASRLWIMKTSREAFHNLGIMLVESLAAYHYSEEKLRSMVLYKNMEVIEQAQKRGKGVVLLSSHFGNWELFSLTFPLWFSIPVTTVAQAQRMSAGREFFRQFRTKKGLAIIDMGRAARTIVKNLRAGEGIAILADQAAQKDKDIYVDFFGHPALTYEAPAALALKFQSSLVIGVFVRVAPGKYEVSLKEISTDGLGSTAEDIRTLTETHVQYLEDIIRKNPGQWSWQHRRWKHQPE